MASIKITQGLDDIQNKISSRTQEALSAAQKGLLDPKVLQKSYQMLQKMEKSFKNMGVDVNKLGKAWNKEMLKGLDDGSKKLERFEKGMKKMYTEAIRMEQRAQRLQGPKGQALITNLAGRYLKQDPNLSVEGAQARASAVVHSAHAGYAQGASDLQSGIVSTAQQKAENDMQERQTRWLRIARGAQFAGAGISAAAGAVQGVLGFEGTEYANKAAALGFNRTMYNSMAAGGAEGAANVWALLKHASKIQSISENASTSSIVGNVGGIGAGVAQTGAGLAITAAAPEFTVMGGGQAIMGGMGQAGRSTMGLLTGENEAARSAAALSAVAHSRVMDSPRFQNALAWATGNAQEWGTRELTGRGSLKDFLFMANAGAGSGVGAGGMQALQDQASGLLGYGDASKRAATIGASAQGQFGYDAATAVGFASSLSAARGTDIFKSKEDFEKTLARGYVLGIKDPQTKNTMLEMVANAAINGAGGVRTGNIGAMMDYAMMGTRDRNDVFYQKASMTSFQEQNQWLGNASGYYGSRGFQIAGDVMTRAGVGRGVNAGAAQKVLGTSNLEDLAGGNTLLSNLLGGNPALAQTMIDQTIAARGRDLASDVQAIGARIHELKVKHKRETGKDLSDQEAFGMIRSGTESGDITARAGLQDWLGTTGGLTPGTSAETGANRWLGILSGNRPGEITSGQVGEAKAGAPGTTQEAELLKATLRAQLDTINGAAADFTKSIGLVAAAWKPLQELALKSEGTEELLKETAAGIAAIREEAEKFNSTMKVR